MDKTSPAAAGRPGLPARLRARGACGVCATSALAAVALAAVLVRPTSGTVAVLVAVVVAQLFACSKLEEQFVLDVGRDGEVVRHRSWTRTTEVRLADGLMEPADVEVSAAGVVIADRSGAAILVPAWRIAHGDALARRIVEQLQPVPA